MIRELKIAVSASGKEAQYDECAKSIAGQKFIIANILARSVDALRGMKPKDIVPYIEGEPYISRVPIEPGLTRFDIICYVRLPHRDGERRKGTLWVPITMISKLNILQEYDVPVEEEFRKDVNEMCNLGEGILEDGIEIGLERGRKEAFGFYEKMLLKNLSG